MDQRKVVVEVVPADRATIRISVSISMIMEAMSVPRPLGARVGWAVTVALVQEAEVEVEVELLARSTAFPVRLLGEVAMAQAHLARQQGQVAGVVVAPAT